jgi:hypothetical protein
MMQITIDDYFMGRDREYAHQLTPEIRQNAVETTALVNALLAEAADDGVEPAVHPVTKTHVSSGWRPPAVNAATANAAKLSTHLAAEACDIADDNLRSLAVWCIRSLVVLERLGLYLEDPRWTKGQYTNWVHVQKRAPGSGRRVFVPSSAKAADPGFYVRHGLKVP